MNRYFLSSEIGVSWFKWATSKRQVDRSVFLCHFLSLHSFYSFPILIQGSWNPLFFIIRILRNHWWTRVWSRLLMYLWIQLSAETKIELFSRPLVIFILFDEKHLTWTWGRLMKCQLCTDDSLQRGGIIPGWRNPRPEVDTRVIPLNATNGTLQSSLHILSWYWLLCLRGYHNNLLVAAVFKVL